MHERVWLEQKHKVTHTKDFQNFSKALSNGDILYNSVCTNAAYTRVSCVGQSSNTERKVMIPMPNPLKSEKSTEIV